MIIHDYTEWLYSREAVAADKARRDEEERISKVNKEQEKKEHLENIKKQEIKIQQFKGNHVLTPYIIGSS